MIISHTHKFIFLKNPKTASSAINNVFRNSGLAIEHARAFKDAQSIGPAWIKGFDISAILDMEFASQENFETYDLYGVYRDPVEVFLSWYTYNTRYATINLSEYYPRAINGVEKLQRFMTDEDRKIINSITPRLMLDDSRLKPGLQTDYLINPRITILNYNNLSNDIPAIIAKYGGTFSEFPVINTFKKDTDVLDNDLIEDIKNEYAVDYLLKDRITVIG